MKTSFLFLVICFAAFLTRAEVKKPNILFIMSDDHSYGAIGAYNGWLKKLNPTPTIDLLAKNGMLFNTAFCNNSICSPSRASLLTGQYSLTNGVVALGVPLPAKKQYIAHEMKKAGYQTVVIGKWHLAAEPGAFDYYAVMKRQGHYYNPQFFISDQNKWGSRDKIVKSGHSSDCVTDLSLDWLKNKRDKTKPFMLLHHFKAPHDKFEYAERYKEYLKDTEIPKPETFNFPPNGSPGSAGFGTKIQKVKIGKFASKEINEDKSNTYDLFIKSYLRCVKGVDDNIKRLIDYLKETGEFDNTVIIYTSDQGYFLGEHGMWDKRWFFEESMKIPLIVHWPKGCKPNTTNKWLINNTDIAPTILDIAGIEKPSYMQGKSFAKALDGSKEPADWRKVTYYRYWMHKALRTPAHFGIRSSRYKLIFFYGQNAPSILPSKSEGQSPVAWELYDLENDPNEMKNIYSNPEYKSIVKDMKEQLKQVRNELNENDTDPMVLKVIEEYWDK